MKLEIKDDYFVVYLNNRLVKINYLNKEVLEDYIKDLIIKIKKIYKIKISGSYIVNIYENKIYGLIIEFKKQDSFELFPDLIDLKLNIYYDSEIYLKLEDYFLINKYKKIYYFDNNFYIDISSLLKKDEIKLSEFCTYIYGKELEKLKIKFISKTY